MSAVHNGLVPQSESSVTYFGEPSSRLMLQALAGPQPGQELVQVARVNFHSKGWATAS